MPTCYHKHTHPPWPSAGPLVICPGERTCGYCTGKDANFNHGLAVNLRKHVYHVHTDGGKRDYAGVEVMMYAPWKGEKRKAGVRRSKLQTDEDDMEVDAEAEEEDEAVEQPEGDQGSHVDGISQVFGTEMVDVHAFAMDGASEVARAAQALNGVRAVRAKDGSKPRLTVLKAKATARTAGRTNRTNESSSKPKLTVVDSRATVRTSADAKTERSRLKLKLGGSGLLRPSMHEEQAKMLPFSGLVFNSMQG